MVVVVMVMVVTVMLETLCARCKKEWAGDPLFVTCPSCRIPHKPSKRAKEGCKRFARPYNNKSGDTKDPGPWNENNVRHLEDG